MKKIVKIAAISLAVILLGVILAIYLGTIFVLPKVLNSEKTMDKFQKYVYRISGIKIESENLKFTSGLNMHINFDADKITAKSKEGKVILILQNVNGNTLYGRPEYVNIEYLYFNKMNFKGLPSAGTAKLKSLPNIHIENGEIIAEDDFKGYISNLNLISGRLTFTGRMLSKKKVAIFKEYEGNFEGNLAITNFSPLYLSGVVKGKDLKSKTTIFGAPMSFKEVNFIFDKEKIYARGKGKFTEDDAIGKIIIENPFNNKREVQGTVKGVLTQKSGKYVPDFKIKNSADLKVDFHTKNRKSAILYTANIKNGSDIFYKNAYLGLQNQNRKLCVLTLINGKKLYIKNYKYSVSSNGNDVEIASGKGGFRKVNGHFKPKYLTVKTNGYAPASVTGSFGKYIAGGQFKGDLKYDFMTKYLLGDFIIKNFFYKDFYVKTAQINAEKENIEVRAKGKYRNENFKVKINAKNRIGKLGEDIIINDLELFLQRYIVKSTFGKGKTALIAENAEDMNKKAPVVEKKFDRKKIKNLRRRLAKTNDPNVTINNWKITVGEVQKDRICLENVALRGYLKNDIFKFTSSKVKFADGFLSANGKYNFNFGASDIIFRASDINSNLASDLIFNLPDQVMGTANGKLRIFTLNKFDDIKAYARFNIEKGYLPKLGNTEFINKKSKRRKIKLSKLINIDTSKPENLASDITGSFLMHNSMLSDINITSKQKYLSFLLEGACDLENDTADLMLFGKYNARAQKGIRILFIPVSFIVKVLFRPENTYKNYEDKLKKIPSIEADEKDTKYFRVKFSGSTKTNDMDVELKSILN